MPAPIQTLQVLSSDQVMMLRDYLQRNYLDSGLLEPDVSNYARGRQRCWLETEAPLSMSRPWQDGHHDAWLWTWIREHVWDKAELGLVAYGPVGISAHRDAWYAGWEAVTINLGEVEAWMYCPQYSDYCYGPQQDAHEWMLHPRVGEVYRFNPKNPHAVINPANDRWSINLWTISTKARAAYEQFRASL